jgi:hypothetical protein
METTFCLLRPGTLGVGQEYLRVERWDGWTGASRTPVIFASYTACPAMVVVCDRAGRRVRCLRDELFQPTARAQWDNPGQRISNDRAIKYDPG